MSGNGLIQKSGDETLYRAQTAAKLAGVSVQTLRMYRRHGLVPALFDSRTQRYAAGDVQWLCCIRELIHVNKISIAALKKLLEYAPCWEIKNCLAVQTTPCARLQNIGK